MRKYCLSARMHRTLCTLCEVANCMIWYTRPLPCVVFKPRPLYLSSFSLVVVVMAAEQMLASYDLSISNKYKLIDYRQDDLNKVATAVSYFSQVTIPVIIGECSERIRTQFTNVMSKFLLGSGR